MNVSKEEGKIHLLTNEGGETMIQHKIGYLLASNTDIIAHQVNCRGVMESGVAKQIREEFPGAYVNYRCACKTAEKAPARLLGYTQITIERFSDGHTTCIANLFAQDNFGYKLQMGANEYPNPQQKNSSAYERCLKLRSFAYESSYFSQYF